MENQGQRLVGVERHMQSPQLSVISAGSLHSASISRGDGERMRGSQSRGSMLVAVQRRSSLEAIVLIRPAPARVDAGSTQAHFAWLITAVAGLPLVSSVVSITSADRQQGQGDGARGGGGGGRTHFTFRFAPDFINLTDWQRGQIPGTDPLFPNKVVGRGNVTPIAICFLTTRCY